MKKILTVLLFAELFLLFSCQNAFNSLDTTSPSSDQKIKITRYFDFSGAVPQNFIPKADSNNKTAFPSVSPGSTRYKAILKNLTDGTTISTDDDPSPAEISIDPANKAISLELTVNKQYVITVQCVKYDDSEIVYLEGSCDPFTLTPTHTVFSETFILQPVMTGNGQVDLLISFSNEVKNMTPTIQIVRVRNLITGQEVQNLFKINPYLDSNKAILVSGNDILPSDIPAGQYSVEIEFRDSIQRIYFIKEVVNVFNNLKTDTFVKNTDEEYYQPNASNKIEIYVTEEMTKRFISSTKYVDSNSTSQSEEGTWTNPYKTLAQAIAAIPSDSTHGYIHIKDGHSEDINEGFDITQNLTIECYKDMPGDGKGNATFKFDEADMQLFSLENTCTSFDVTGITLDGNNISSGSTGLFIDNKNTARIITATNCTVINCLATPNGEGGAIFNAGTLTLNNCTLINNSLEQGSQDEYETGGAIYNKGTLTLNNTTITGNTAEIAGGVYTTKPIVIQGTTIIKDNKSIDDSGNETASNLYLAKDTSGTTPQSYIDCTDSIPASGSEIHITTETKPTVAEPVTVLKNFYSHSGCKPEDFFISDEDYPIVKKDGINDACLKIGGGTLTVKTFDDIKISIDKNKIKKGANFNEKAITITVKDGQTTLERSKITSLQVGWFLNGKSKIYSSMTPSDNFTTSSFNTDNPFGLYQFVVYIEYNSKKYQAVFDVEYYENNPRLAYQSEAPQDGTYSVCTFAELQKIKDWATGNKLGSAEFVLENDIDVPPANANNFTIGSLVNSPFKGTFNGNGYKISGITKSLFNFATGTIKNLTLEGSVTGKAAAFVENNTNEARSVGNLTIENCVNKANINANNVSASSGSTLGIGAFLGKTVVQNVYIIKNCINYGNIESNVTAYIGGIAGDVGANIINCINYGNIKSTRMISSERTGGIAGNRANIENCINFGNVSGTVAGGIMGGSSYYNGSTQKAVNCVNMGKIEGTGTNPSVGQIIGIIQSIDSLQNIDAYDYCYYLKAIDDSGAEIPGVGTLSGKESSDCQTYLFTIQNDGSAYSTQNPISVNGKTGTDNLINLLNNYAESDEKYCQWLLLANSLPPKPVIKINGVND